MSIKSCFKSRYPNGYLMEVDFSQLEVIGLAILSNDPVLKNDIRLGLDMHRKRASELLDIPESDVTDEQRRLAKRLSFQLQYGAGAKSMAEKNGIPKTLAEKFIVQYYDRYRGVLKWQHKIALEVQASRKPSGKHTPNGHPQGAGEHQSPTGRLYKFYEYDSQWKKDPSFSPTEMKNYPVQGFATGDIMAVYRAKLYRRWIREGLASSGVLVNTVHDSVMVDCRTESDVKYLFRVMEEEANNLPTYLKELWNIECDLPFKVECKYGPTWAETTKLED